MTVLFLMVVLFCSSSHYIGLLDGDFCQSPPYFSLMDAKDAKLLSCRMMTYIVRMHLTMIIRSVFSFSNT